MNYIEKHKASGFKVGDNVLVTRAASSKEDGWGCSWVNSMDCYVGCTFKITEDRNSAGFMLGSNGYFFPYFILQLVGKKESKPSKDYPYVCPRCGAPSYNGLLTVDCSRSCK
jgi:hypothetical protein